MAAKNKVDPCMFCGDVPCSCNGPASKPQARKKKEAASCSDSVKDVQTTKPAQPASPSTSAPKPDLRAAMLARKKVKPQQEPAPVAELPKATGQSTHPTVDIKTAMLTRTKIESKSAEYIQLRVVEQEATPAYDDDFSTALRALSIILHPEEKRTYADILINPKTRAHSWRRRNR